MNDEQKQIQIDRMVDGELSPPEQRELLASCDHSESWRDLALAYVESQVWRTELGSVVDERQAACVNPEPERRSWGGDWSPLALAAAVLLALGAGYGLGWSWQDTPLPGARNIADTKIAPAESAPRSELSSMPLMVSDPANDGLRRVDLPIVKASDLHPNWERDLQAAIPEEVSGAFRQSGVDLHRARVFAPVELGDGRRVIVPIEYYIERDYQ